MQVASIEIPMESGWTGFKIGWQGFSRRRKAPTIKLYISKHFSAKCVTQRRCSCLRQFKFILLSLVTTQCTTFLIEINKQIMYSTMIYGSPIDPRVDAIIDLAPKTCIIYSFFVYILHPKLPLSTIHPHIGTWFSFGSQIIY